MRFEQRNSQDTVSDQQDDQRQHQRGEESGRPSQVGELALFRLPIEVGKRRLLAGLMDDIAAIEEHGAFEQAMCDQMEHGEGKGAQAAFHDHVAHLPDGRKAQRFLDVVLSQHHGGAEDGRQHADDEDHV